MQNRNFLRHPEVTVEQPCLHCVKHWGSQKLLAQLQSECASKRGQWAALLAPNVPCKRPTLQKFSDPAGHVVPRWTKTHTVSFIWPGRTSCPQQIALKVNQCSFFNFLSLLRVNRFLPEASSHTTCCGAVMRPRLALCLPQLWIKAASKVPLQNKLLHALTVNYFYVSHVMFSLDIDLIKANQTQRNLL